MITLLGLGPGDPNLLTREAWDILSAAAASPAPAAQNAPNTPKKTAKNASPNASPIVLLRTRKHPTVAGLPAGLRWTDFDGYYDDGESFEAVYARIVEAVIAAAQQHGDVIYAVPGHPLVGEATTPAILRRAAELNIPTRIVSGLSFIEPTLGILSDESLVLNRSAIQNLKPITQHSLDPVDGLQLCDALEIAAMHHPPINPDKPALVAQVYSRAIASDVKLTLMNQYAPDHVVYVVRASDERTTRKKTSKKGKSISSKSSSSPASRCLETPLHELDHHDVFDHLTSLYVPPMTRDGGRVGGFEAFQETVAYLRAPEGCPWDREQTHASLRGTLLEEAYEVLTAIDEDDMPALQEELGDLLLNVVLQAQIATEAEEFRMADVIAGINAKLVRRHPHVFGDARVTNASDVNVNWDKIKKQEKAAKGQHDASVLDSIAPALPALAQAQKMAHRAEKAGFRWDSHNERLAKVHEEIEEIVTAKNKAHRAEEFGDLCFTIADWADGYDIDIEVAAREANLKFARRFRKLEGIVRKRGLDLSAMSQADMLKVWREVKKAEKAEKSGKGGVLRR